MKYPNGIKKDKKRETCFSNRGMKLESELNDTNKYYLNLNIACIHKKPTPIKVVDVYYKSCKEAVITKAYFEKQSTLDYNGIYKGKYIDFEAKETKNSNYFPLKNIHTHQIKHMEKVIQMNGITFLIIRFSSLNLTFYLDGSKLLSFIEKNDRKSIPVSYFKEHGIQILDKLRPTIDYIKVIDDLYFKGGIYENK